MTQIVENEGSGPVTLFAPSTLSGFCYLIPYSPTLPTLTTADRIAADRQTKLHLVTRFIKIKGTVHKKR